MVVTLQNHSGSLSSLNSTICLNTVKPRHRSSQSNKAPLGDATLDNPPPPPPPPTIHPSLSHGDLAVVWGPESRQAIANRLEKGVSAAGGGSVCLKLPNRRRPRGGGGAGCLKVPNSSPPPTPRRICTERTHSADVTGRNWGVLAQLAIFLPKMDHITPPQWKTTSCFIPPPPPGQVQLQRRCFLIAPNG